MLVGPCPSLMLLLAYRLTKAVFRFNLYASQWFLSLRDFASPMLKALNIISGRRRARRHPCQSLSCRWTPRSELTSCAVSRTRERRTRLSGRSGGSSQFIILRNKLLSDLSPPVYGPGKSPQVNALKQHGNGRMLNATVVLRPFTGPAAVLLVS